MGSDPRVVPLGLTPWQPNSWPYSTRPFCQLLKSARLDSRLSACPALRQPPLVPVFPAGPNLNLYPKALMPPGQPPQKPYKGKTSHVIEKKIQNSYKKRILWGIYERLKITFFLSFNFPGLVFLVPQELLILKGKRTYYILS